MTVTGTVDSKHISLSDYVDVPSTDLFEKCRQFKPWVKDLEQRRFAKYRLPVIAHDGGRSTVRLPDGSTTAVLNFCCADYLGLNSDEALVQASIAATASKGTSVSAVPLIAGNTSVHAELTRALCELTGHEAAVVFPTGQSANSGTIAALVSAKDHLVVDKQVHASVLEGARLSGASWNTFRHSDPEHLDRVLTRIRKKHRRGILVVVEGVYGLDGDLPPLPQMIAVARRHDARIMVDDAQATGVLGARGGGSGDHHGVDGMPDLTMGSFSKALGSFGGWIAGSRETIEYLAFFARGLVFSVGLPPACMAAAHAGVIRLQQAPELVAELQEKSRYFRDGLVALGFENAAQSRSSIVSVRIDDEGVLRECVRDLFEAGVWGEGLPFPAVSRGQERLRFRVRNVHTYEDLDIGLKTIGEVLGRHGVLRRTRAETDCVGDRSGARSLLANAATIAASGLQRVTWVDQAFLARIVENAAPWSSAVVESRCFTSADGATSLRASIADVSAAGGTRRQGFLGDFCCTSTADGSLAEPARQALEWLAARVTSVVAPASAPLQVLGGGFQEGAEEALPFLEPSAAARHRVVLEGLGFGEVERHRYVRVSLLVAIESLRGRAVECASDGNAAAAVRNLSRPDLLQDLRLIAPVARRSIGHLSLCSPLDDAAFVAIARELRELLLPDLWSIAEVGSEAIGFAGGFPQLTDAFQAAAGACDVSDIDFFERAIATARTGFLAWVGVDDGVSERLAAQLALRTLEAMQRRGFSSVILSWELAGLVDWTAELAEHPEARVADMVLTGTSFTSDATAGGGHAAR